MPKNDRAFLINMSKLDPLIPMIVNLKTFIYQEVSQRMNTNLCFPKIQKSLYFPEQILFPNNSFQRSKSSIFRRINPICSSQNVYRRQKKSNHPAFIDKTSHVAETIRHVRATLDRDPKRELS